MSLRYPILAGARVGDISSYNEHDEQDISHVSGENIDKDTNTTKSNVANDTSLPPEVYAGVMECKFLVCNYIT